MPSILPPHLPPLAPTASPPLASVLCPLPIPSPVPPRGHAALTGTHGRPASSAVERDPSLLRRLCPLTPSLLPPPPLGSQCRRTPQPRPAICDPRPRAVISLCLPPRILPFPRSPSPPLPLLPVTSPSPSPSPSTSPILPPCCGVWESPGRPSDGKHRAGRRFEWQ